MSDELTKHYQGDDASAYEARRSADPKWQFEHQCLSRALQRYGREIDSIVDAPVGTGRFLDLYASLGGGVRVSGIDYSDDMLHIARARAEAANVEFLRQDIVNRPLQVRADAVVCYRFVNLLPWDDAARVLSHLFAATGKVLIVAIRTIPDEYTGETFIENKIYLHRRSAIDAVARTHGFSAVDVALHPSARAGDYSVTTFLRERPLRDVRVNKNARLVCTYGAAGNEGKVYEVKDAAHARFIRAITNQSELAGYFPWIRGTSANFVDAEWCAGELLEATAWDGAVELLARIQALRADGESSFDYVDDLVLPRFRRTIPLVGIEVCDRVVARIQELSARFDSRVSHPDVIPGNVVRSGSQVTLIDNELLCRSRHYRLDILNVLNNLEAAIRGQVISTYLRLTEQTVDAWETEREYLSNVWFARQLGSLIVTNQLDRARECCRAWERGENILPYHAVELTR